MVLETIISPLKAENKPWKMFFLGIIYSTIALFLSTWVFSGYAGLVMVFLTVLAALPVIHATIRLEEKKDHKDSGELFLLKEHWKALSFFMFLFLGFVVSFSFWYMVLPNTMVADIFSAQMDTIRAVNSIGADGNFTSTSSFFWQILLNNVKVLFFTVLFSLFYGAGAVFILAWNASVVGAAAGNFARGTIHTIAVDSGLATAGNYFATYSLGLLRYMTHGAFEILAYFMAALAGGIISIAIVRHGFGSKNFRRVAADSVDLIALSLAVLFLAAVIEVFITPLLF